VRGRGKRGATDDSVRFEVGDSVEVYCESNSNADARGSHSD
jgi:hypothetical protein